MKIGKLKYPTLTVDPGYHTGWATWAKEGILKPKMFGTIVNLHRENDWADRMNTMAAAFDAIVRGQQVKTVCLEFVALWELSMKSRTSAVKGDTFRLAYLIGGYGKVAHDNHCNLILIQPDQWKGNMDKNVLSLRVKRATGHIYEDHVCDAVGIGLYLQRAL